MLQTQSLEITGKDVVVDKRQADEDKVDRSLLLHHIQMATRGS
jgi:hypothetical protein